MFSLAPLPPRGDKARPLAKFLLLLGPLLYGALAYWLGQDANWDLRNYHWYNAYAFLQGRHGYDLLPSQTPFFYSPVLDVFFYLLARLLNGPAVGIALGIVQGLNFCLLFMLAHAVLIIPKSPRRVLVAAALAALGMIGGGSLGQVGTTFNDNMVSLGLLGSILLTVLCLPHLLQWPIRRAFLPALLIGIPAGLALGLKLTLITFCAAVTLAWLFVAGRFTHRLLLAFAFGCGLTLGLCLAQGYWMWFLWTHYENPLFPYFNQYFGSPYAPLASARDTQFIPAAWQDRLIFPWLFSFNPRLVGEVPWQDWRILILCLLLPLCSLAAVIVGRRHDPSLVIAERLGARYLLWAAVLSYVFWLLLFCIYRYLIPLEMLAPLLIVLSVGLLPLRPQIKWLAAAALLFFIAASVRGSDWGRVGWSENFVRTLAPAVPEPENTMLLMAGFEPYSHILTAFDPVMPVIRIQSNFASPNEGEKGINRIIAGRLQGHKGRFMLLIPDWQVTHGGLAQEALAHYGLKFREDNCRKFPDNLGYSYALCPVEKVPSP